MVEWSTFHYSPSLAVLVNLLGSEVEDRVAASTERAGEREEGGALAFLLGTLTGKGEGEAEGEGLESVADRIFGTGEGMGEGAL